MIILIRCYLRKTAVIMAAFFIMASLDIAPAIQIGKVVEYRGGGMGKVVFDGKKHNDAGHHCMKCHNTYFIPKIGDAKIKYSDHAERKVYCFGCHNGTIAFDAIENCTLCHKKSN